MPAPTSALRSNSVEGYARKDDWSIFRGRLRGPVRWLRKIEKPKSAAVPTVV
jgi:hypothetical protein